MICCRLRCLGDTTYLSRNHKYSIHFKKSSMHALKFLKFCIVRTEQTWSGQMHRSCRKVEFSSLPFSRYPLFELGDAANPASTLAQGTTTKQCTLNRQNHQRSLFPSHLGSEKSSSHLTEGAVLSQTLAPTTFLPGGPSQLPLILIHLLPTLFPPSAS